jgi:hypothetical protein
MGGLVQALCLAGMIASVVWLRTDHVILGEALAACFATLVLFRFRDIIKFKALGVEIEQAARKARKVAREAKATTDQLRALAAILGKLELDNLGLRNRLGVLPPRTLLSIRDRVVEVLQIAGCSEEEVRRATTLLESTIRFDFAGAITASASKFLMQTLPKRHDDERYKAFAQKIGDLNQKQGPLSPAPANEYRLLLDEFDVQETEAQRCLEEFELYDRTGETPSREGDSNYFPEM